MCGTKKWKRQQYCNGCRFVHFYRLTPILPGHPSILLFANFSQKCGFDGKQKDVLCLLMQALATKHIRI